MSKTVFLTFALVLGIFWPGNLRAQSSDDWAQCIVSEAPVSGKNWLALGGPRSRLGEDEAKRARNLGFRLKAICASALADEEDIHALKFNDNSVFKSLKKLNAKSPIASQADDENFDMAGFCSTSFFIHNLDEIGDDAATVDRELLSQPAMSTSQYDLIDPAVPNPSLITAKQSNGSPIKIFSECLVIASDGSLVDA